MYARRYLKLISFLQSLPLLLLLASPNVSAENDIELPLTAESAAEYIKAETQGRILSIQEDALEDKAIFRIKVLHTDGTMKTYRIERDTGIQF